MFHSGLGATTATTAGAIETFGSGGAYGIFTRSISTANTAQHRVELNGSGTLVTHGDDGIGIRMAHAGSGMVDARMGGTSRIATAGNLAHGIWAESALGAVSITQAAGTTISTAGEEAHGIRAAAHTASAFDIAGTVQASGLYSVGISATSATDTATVVLASGANVTGGWQANTGGAGTTLSAPSAGLLIASAASSVVTNAGAIGAASDRAIADASRGTAAGGSLRVQNTGTITGFLEYAAASGNRFTNAAGGVLALRHFADTNGDGTRDTKRVSISDFGAPDSVFDNAGTVRLATVTGATTTDAAGYHVPSRPLEPGFYNLNRTGIVQAQLVNLGTFNHSGIIDLRGEAIGNTLVITGQAAGGSTPGSGIFITNGGTLHVNAVLNDGMTAGGASNSYADILIVDSTRLGTAPTAVQVGYDPTSLGGLTAGNGIQLVEVLNKGASAAGVFVLGNKVAAGATNISFTTMAWTAMSQTATKAATSMSCFRARTIKARWKRWPPRASAPMARA